MRSDERKRIDRIFRKGASDEARKQRVREAMICHEKDGRPVVI